MKMLFGAGLALVILSVPALAQPDDQPQSAQQGESQQSQSRLSDAQSSPQSGPTVNWYRQDHHRRGRDDGDWVEKTDRRADWEPRGGRDEESGPEDGDGHSHRSMGPRPRMDAQGARFRVKVGDVEVGIKCADDEPVKTCTEFTLQLVDKLGALVKH